MWSGWHSLPYLGLDLAFFFYTAYAKVYPVWHLNKSYNDQPKRGKKGLSWKRRTCGSLEQRLLGSIKLDECVVIVEPLENILTKLWILTMGCLLNRTKAPDVIAVSNGSMIRLLPLVFRQDSGDSITYDGKFTWQPPLSNLPPGTRAHTHTQARAYTHLAQHDKIEVAETFLCTLSSPATLWRK